MPHTRRARELGLSRVVIGPQWDSSNLRYKLRLCWGEECLALCLGSDGMTEIRISLNNIAIQDLGGGCIEIRMIPNFPRKFFGHTARHYNSLREVHYDPTSGSLDASRSALCFVRGGDPKKLATDFVARVERFREEVGRPAPPAHLLPIPMQMGLQASVAQPNASSSTSPKMAAATAAPTVIEMAKQPPMMMPAQMTSIPTHFVPVTSVQQLNPLIFQVPIHAANQVSMRAPVPVHAANEAAMAAAVQAGRQAVYQSQVNTGINPMGRPSHVSNQQVPQPRTPAPLSHLNTNQKSWSRPVGNVGFSGNQSITPLPNFVTGNATQGVPNSQANRNVNRQYGPYMVPTQARAFTPFQNGIGALTRPRMEESARPSHQLLAPPPTPEADNYKGDNSNLWEPTLAMNDLLPSLARKIPRYRISQPTDENTSASESTMQTEHHSLSQSAMLALLRAGSVPDNNGDGRGKNVSQAISANWRLLEEQLRSDTDVPIAYKGKRPPTRPTVITTTPPRPQQNTNGYYNTPSSQGVGSMLNTPSPLTSSSDISNESTAFDHEGSDWGQAPDRKPYHPLDEKNYPTRVLDYKKKENKPSSVRRGAIILRHACSEKSAQGFSVRTVPSWASLAQIKVLAAYFFSLPLEELSICGKYDGQEIVLRNELDWAGYYDVCTASRARIYIDVTRDNQYGKNSCDGSVDPRKIWGPIGPFTLPLPIPATLGSNQAGKNGTTSLSS